MEEKIKIINPDRIIAFSDGVFAFAITLLVLKINLPNTAVSSNLPTILIQLWPQFLANIMSFSVIGYYWILHHYLFNHIKRYDITVVWLNIFLLMAISFMPFSTDLLGDFPNSEVAVIFYALTLAITGILQSAVWIYASHNHRLIDKELSSGYIHAHSVRAVIPPLIFLLSIPVSYISITLAECMWILIFFVSGYIAKLQKVAPHSS